LMYARHGRIARFQHLVEAGQLQAGRGELVEFGPRKRPWHQAVRASGRRLRATTSRVPPGAIRLPIDRAHAALVSSDRTWTV